MPHCCLSKSTWSKCASDSSASKAPSSRAPLALSARLASSSRLCSSAHIWPMSSGLGLRSRAWSRCSSRRDAWSRTTGTDGQEDRCGLAAPAGPHEAADGLGEEERRRGRRGVDADREARHVDALGHHADGDHPALVARAEVLDALARAEVVGEDDRRGLAGQRAEDGGIRPRLGLVGGDDEPAGVLDVAAHLGEAAVGGGEHRGDPLPLGVERRAPRVRDEVLRHRLAEARLELVAGLGAPAHAAAVGHEEDGPHDAVAQRLGVAVRVVARADEGALGVELVGDERDRRGVGAEGRARQRQATGRGLEGLADAVAPALRVTAVVHLVEDDERRARRRQLAVQRRARRDLGVGHGDAVVVVAVPADAVAELRVEADADPGGGVGPLGLEVLGGGHDGDALRRCPRSAARWPRAGRTSSCRRPAWRPRGSRAATLPR